jgi:hypothetical protein
MGIEVIDVQVVPSNGAATGSLWTPEGGATLQGFGVELAGWASSTSGAIEDIEIRHGDMVVRRTRGRSSAAMRVGNRLDFRTHVNLIGLPSRCRLVVAANTEGGRVDLAQVTLERSPLQTPLSPVLQPMIVTTMGRTGSVWFARLLGEHPAITTYRPFETEPRIGSYWMHVLRDLADPASYLQALAPRELAGHWWLPDVELDTTPRVPDPALALWMQTAHVERLAVFCQESLDAFYRGVCFVQGKRDVAYFSEKYNASFVVNLLLELYPRAREVFLVRDPRDQLASIVAWNERGRAQFGQDAQTAEDYLPWLSARTKHELAHWRARKDGSLLVRYEDLLLEPKQTLETVLHYLDLDASSDTVQHVIASARASTPSFQEAHRTAKSFRASIGRWRSDIDPALWPALDSTFEDEIKAWYPDDSDALPTQE